MKRSTTRRNFLRDTSLTATGLAIVSFTNKKDIVQKTIVGCAPSKISFLSGTISSTKSGNWSDPATWGGRLPSQADTPLISSGHIVNYDLGTGTFSGVNVNAGGTLQFDPAKSCELKTSKNVIIEGLLEMRPQESSKIHFLQFINVDENAFVGGGMTPMATDIGLWVMGTGKLNIVGAAKKAWTNAVGSVNAGATSFAVKDTTGWNVGDEIVIVPTDAPDGAGLNFDEATQMPIDPFFKKFERRIVSSISGNTVSFTEPLLHNHNSVTSSVTSSELGKSSSRTWTAEVANLTRNVRIEGTAKGRSHIFVCSSSVHTVKYVQGRFLGPRKFQGRNRKELVTGRYGLHFHHCNFGSKGSIVEGCAFSDMGNRVYVPHVSHGIAFKSNVSFNSLETAFWWDFADKTHETIYDGNLFMAVLSNGVTTKSGMTLVLGDRNVAINNVGVYAHIGDTRGAGAFSWEPNSSGVWVFENNLAHSNHGGTFIWDNGPDNHFLLNYDTYNNIDGCFHGAYGNIWTFFGGHHYRSPFGIKATSTNTFGVVFKDVVFDAGGRDYAIFSDTSAIKGHDHSTNKLIGCIFRNFAKKAAYFYGMGEPKWFDFINCDIPNGSSPNPNLFDWKETIDGFTARIQPKNGQAYQLQKLGGQVVLTTIPDFATKVYGSGHGLKGEYFLGKNFERPVFSRLDPALIFQAWSTGVDNTIPLGTSWSARWTGFIEPQFTEQHTFRIIATGGARMWLNDQLVLDEWWEGERRKTVTLPLTAGQKLKIKVEQYHESARHGGMQLFWKAPSMKYEQNVMQCQLYSESNSISPISQPEIANQGPLANAGVDMAITLPTNTITLNGSASKDPDGTISSFKWTKVTGPAGGVIVSENQASTEVKDLVQGTYFFRLKVTDDKGATHEDDVTITVNPQPTEVANQKPLANAGADIVLTLPANSTTLNGTASKDVDGSIVAFKWVKVSGPSQYAIANANTSTTALTNLAQGTYIFRLQVTDNKGATSEDDVTVIVNPEATKSTDQKSPTDTTLKVTVAPNPTRSVFRATFAGASGTPISCSLYSKFGILLDKRTCRSGDTINVGGGLKPGTYYGVAEQGSQKVSITLIKL